ncbi:MAG: hypothetical protein PHF72_13515 [Gammaproteobacteria bacterium]|nr:hypothetical protein [Gammaproteobacteria bacterium]
MARKAVFLCIVVAWINGCADSPVDRPDAARSYLGQAAFTCLVDSSLYSHSHSPVEDGAEVTFQRSGNGFGKVLVNGEDMFIDCEERTIKINARQARALLAYTDIEDLERFVGAEVGFCRRIDDGWYFLLREDSGFIAYTGPAELPLAVVGMSCE